MGKYPKIIFYVSDEYNQMFAHFSGGSFTKENFRALLDVEYETQELWNKCNDKVFRMIAEKTCITLEP